MVDRIQVPYLIRDPELKARVEAAVVGTPVQLIPTADLDELTTVADLLGAVCLIDDSEGMDSASLVGFVYSRPVNTIAVLDRSGSMPPSVEIRVQPVDPDFRPDALLHAVLRARMAVLSEGLVARLPQVPDSRMRLRDAVRSVLRATPEDGLFGCGAGVASAAQCVNVSRGHLSSLQSDSGISLNRIEDIWAMLWALGEHRIVGRPLKVVAGSLGYAGHTGLTELFKRACGEAPSRLHRPFESAVLDVVAEILGQFKATEDDGR